jgi:hypothetical protein
MKSLYIPAQTIEDRAAYYRNRVIRACEIGAPSVATMYLNMLMGMQELAAMLEIDEVMDIIEEYRIEAEKEYSRSEMDL